MPSENYRQTAWKADKRLKQMEKQGATSDKAYQAAMKALKQAGKGKRFDVKAPDSNLEKALNKFISKTEKTFGFEKKRTSKPLTASEKAYLREARKADKQLRALEKAGMTNSPAYRKAMADIKKMGGGKRYTSKKLARKKKAANNVKKFFTKKTATVQGVNEASYKARKTIEQNYGLSMTEQQYKKFWESGLMETVIAKYKFDSKTAIKYIGRIQSTTGDIRELMIQADNMIKYPDRSKVKEFIRDVSALVNKGRKYQRNQKASDDILDAYATQKVIDKYIKIFD